MDEETAPAVAGGGTRAIPGRLVTRAATFERAGLDVEARTVDLVFSSEHPVERWFGMEVLSHAAGAVRMSWIASGRAPLCANHDLRDVLGVVESVTFSGTEGRARVRFGRSARAEEYMQDVADGIRTAVSVGYRIHAMELTEQDGDARTYTVTDWEPYEISLVSYPADPSAGVRSADMTLPPIIVRDTTMEDDTTAPAPAATRAASAAPAAPVPAAPVPAAPAAGRSAVGDVPAYDPAAEAERIRAVMAMGERHNMRELAERAAMRGATPEQFAAVLLEQRADGAGNAAMRPDTDIGMSEREVRQFSLFRAIRAAAAGDWRLAPFEREASDAVAERIGRDARGFYLPGEVLARFGDVAGATRAALSTSAGGTGLVGTTHAAGSFIELLRSRAIVGQLGARTLSGLVGNVDIPKMIGGATAYWIGEGGETTGSGGTFGTVSMSPHTVSGEVELTRRLILQSSPEAEALVRDDLLAVLALAVDAAAFSGAGGAEPTGILGTSGVGLVALGADGGAPTWAKVVALETEVASANADAGAMAYVTTPRGRGVMKVTEKAPGTARFLWGDDNAVNGYRAVASNQVPGNLTKGTGTGLSALLFGNFGDVVIGEWGVMDVKVDEVTRGKSGGLILRAFHDVDVAVRHGQSFAVAKDMVTA